MLNVSTTNLNIETIKYYEPEKINSFFVGVVKNNYLILSVIQENFELFKFLLIEKKAKAEYINENGWSILNFIILKKLWVFFSFLFNLPLPDECDTTQKIYKCWSVIDFNCFQIGEFSVRWCSVGQQVLS